MASAPPAALAAAAEPVNKRPRTAVDAPHMRFLRRRELGVCPPADGAHGTPAALRAWVERETLRKLDTGEYVPLDKNAQLVRSTISIALSHDGRFFASTHGDHSVKVFEYPSRKQIACLDGHPRTPWTVRFHPTDSNIVASGCLGNECRVWNVAKAKCVRKHTFRASISCVSFAPTGDALAVTSGRSLLLWHYKEPPPNGTIFTRTPPEGHDGQQPNIPMFPNGGEVMHDPDADPRIHKYLPIELLSGNNPFHMVDFHSSGKMLMTGEKNRIENDASEQESSDVQFTLRLVIHRFDRRMGVRFAEPLLVVPRVVAYNDAGIHFSQDGRMLAACVPVTPESEEFHLAVISIEKTATHPVGSVICKVPMDKGHVTALTNLSFSSTSRHLLAGFSFRPQNPVLRNYAEHFDELAAGRANRQPALRPCGAPFESPSPQMPVVDIYSVGEDKLKKIRSLNADMDIAEDNIGGAQDEINVAVFAPRDGIADGVIYGTQKGRIRIFQQASGRVRYPPGVCDENCNICRLSLPYLLPPLPTTPSPAGPVRTEGVWSRYHHLPAVVSREGDALRRMINAPGAVAAETVPVAGIAPGPTPAVVFVPPHTPAAPPALPPMMPGTGAQSAPPGTVIDFLASSYRHQHAWQPAAAAATTGQSYHNRDFQLPPAAAAGIRARTALPRDVNMQYGGGH